MFYLHFIKKEKKKKKTNLFAMNLLIASRAQKTNTIQFKKPFY